MAIKVLVNGAFGKMGQLTCKTIQENSDFELVGQTGREYDLKQSIIDSQADVVIDFTTAANVFKNAMLILETNTRLVIGTSGLVGDQIKELQTIAKQKKVGGIIAPNFSLGAVLMMKHAREIARYMPEAEIIEMHHDGKLDSPSGTAIRSAQLISHDGEKPASKAHHESIKGARGANYKGIPIHSVRLKGLLAHQEIIFGNIGETLTLRHDSIDRSSFMPGVCLACKKVMSLNELVYGLEEVI